MKFVSAYGPKNRVGCYTGPETLTKKSMAKECDVNYIVKRWSAQGVLPKVTALEAIYGDVTGLDYQRALDLVRGAEDAFIGLPAAVRKRFGNDAGAFLTFCDDPKNVDELVTLGLATRREAAELAREETTPSAESAGAPAADA